MGDDKTGEPMTADPQNVDIDTWLMKSRIQSLSERNRAVEKALLIAAGIISTHPNWSSWHPEAVYEMLLGEDRHG